MLLSLPLLARPQATNLPTELIYETSSKRRLTLSEFASQVRTPEILLLGEQHAVNGEAFTQQENQLRLLKLLPQVSVGMEFLEYPSQLIVDQYLTGGMSDLDFENAIGWGGSPFAAYREQILWPAQSGGTTRALNIPRAVTAEVAKCGLGCLSLEHRQWLPNPLKRGSQLYFERFSEAMAGHVTPEQLQNYFWAQSIWDETMAWQSVAHMQSRPLSRLAVIVGEFHVEYELGLPARLTDRLARAGLSNVRVSTLVQRALPKLDEATISAAVAADAKYGILADYIWMYKGAGAPPTPLLEIFRANIGAKGK